MPIYLLACWRERRHRDRRHGATPLTSSDHRPDNIRLATTPDRAVREDGAPVVVREDAAALSGPTSDDPAAAAVPTGGRVATHSGDAA